MKYIIAIVIMVLLISMPTVYASEQIDKSSDMGSQMVSNGMKIFAYSIGDSMISLGTGNETMVRENRPV
jgi:hypothetical protein